MSLVQKLASNAPVKPASQPAPPAPQAAVAQPPTQVIHTVTNAAPPKTTPAGQTTYAAPSGVAEHPAVANHPHVVQQNVPPAAVMPNHFSLTSLTKVMKQHWVMIIILIVVLVIIAGMCVGIYYYRQSIINWWDKIKNDDF